MSTSAWKNPALWVVLGTLAISAVGLGAAINYFRIYLDKREIYPADGRLLRALPSETRSWRQVGVDQLESPEVEITLGTTNYVTRLYVEKNPPEGRRPYALQFHSAYYTGMIDTVPHVPERCFVGGGLQIGSIVGELPLGLDTTRWQQDPDVPEHLRSRVLRMRLPNESDAPGSFVRTPRDAADLRLNTFGFLDTNQRPFFAGYFFIANGGWVARAEGVRLLSFNLNDYYAYYLKVQFTSFNDPAFEPIDTGEELAQVAARFLDEMLPEIMRCVPDWIEVEAGRYPPDSGVRPASATPSPQ